MVFSRSFFTAALLAACGATAAQAAGQTPAQVAQDLIFDGDHLGSAPAPSDITYAYEYDVADPSRYGKGFKDHVTLHLAPGAAPDKKNVRLDMYTGERRRDPIELDGRKANPVILMFLEQDLWHMRQRTGVMPNFFKARIAGSLKNDVTVEDTTVQIDGHPAPGKRVTIKPFVNEPQGSEAALFRSKIYEFTFSDAAPGSVVELKAVTTDQETKDDPKPLFEEKVTFEHFAAAH